MSNHDSSPQHPGRRSRGAVVARRYLPVVIAVAVLYGLMLLVPRLEDTGTSPGQLPPTENGSSRELTVVDPPESTA